ncbi:methyl-accepting chemotaxis protein [Lichenicoccus sp.]|uniref:methyl-accepting chemotaxis protein n=1 Tax=Lichenicoccus sp. TaxID=2781899 RepID=UPI003D0ABC70
MQSSSLVSETTGLRFGLGAKLGAGFAALTLFSLLLGGLAMNRMSAVDAKSADVSSNYLPSEEQSAQLGLAVGNARRLQLRYLLAQPGTADAKEAMTRLQASVDQANRARQKYDRLIDAGAERQRFTAVFDPSWKDFQSALAESERLKDTKQDAAALDVVTGKSEREFYKLSDFSDWDLEYSLNAGLTAANEARALYVSTWWLIAGAIVLVLMLSSLTAFALIRHISRPLVAMTEAMRSLANKEMTTAIPCVGRGDEIGSMASAVKVFKDNMIAGARLAADQEAEQSGKAQRVIRVEALVSGFESKVGQMVGMLAAASTEMEATAQTMSTTAVQTNQQASVVASAAEVASVGVQTVAAAAEQLSSSITEISRQVTQSARVSEKAVADVRRTDIVVRALADGAQKIGDVVNLITNIAGQTNLLALNATIEAARAGDAGKGFAVVASEVKSLAQQTAKATDDIGKQIAEVQNATAEAVAAIRGISVVIEEIGAIATMIAAAVEEQGAATAEIARNVQQTAASTRTVTSSIAGVSKAANETGTAAAQVLDAAGDLSRQAEGLSSEVGCFVTDIRAA